MRGPTPIRTKPKYSRASAPKVRTGCLTWIRHVKCDEAKPTCKKCQVSKVTCDGYLPPEDKQVAQKKSRKTRTPFNNDTHSGLLLLRACLDPDTLQDCSGSAFFHHFRTSTVTDLALSPYSTCFWDLHVLPLSNAIPAVRYAATALGAAHRAFLLESSDPSAREAKQWLETIAVHQYNKAISQLLPNSSSGGLVDVRTMVTCSLLFYCLENIRGRPDESIQHLKAGSKLILSLSPHSLTETGQSGTKREDSIGEIASFFARLGVQASLYKEDEVVPDLRAYIPPVSSLPDDPSHAFRDFNAARNSLFDIDVDLGTITNRSFVLARSGHRDFLLAQEGSSIPQLTNGSDPGTPVQSNTLVHGPSYADGLNVSPIISRFRSWRRRFDKTVAEAEKRGTTKRERQEIAMLELRRRVFETMLEEVPDGDPKQADRILHQAEIVLQSFSKHPIFTLESSVSPSVSFLCFYSNDKRHVRRALRILRSARMREGVWDSSSLAATIEPQFPDLDLRSTAFTTSSEDLSDWSNI